MKLPFLIFLDTLRPFLTLRSVTFCLGRCCSLREREHIVSDDPDNGKARSFGNNQLVYKDAGLHRYFALPASFFINKPPLSFYWLANSFFYAPGPLAMSPSTVSVISQFHVSLAPLDAPSTAVSFPPLFVVVLDLVVLDLVDIAGGASLHNVIGVFSSFEKAAQAGKDQLDLLNWFRSQQEVFRWIRTQPKVREMSCSEVFRNSAGDSVVLSMRSLCWIGWRQ